MLLGKSLFDEGLKSDAQFVDHLQPTPSVIEYLEIQASDKSTDAHAQQRGAGNSSIAYCDDTPPGLSPHDKDFFERWKSVVSSHFLDPELTVAKLAKLSYLSQRQLFNKVKLVTGRSPKAWLDEYRICLAKELLSTRAISISQVSEETGFSSSSNFSKTFKKITGMTPSIYRRRATAFDNGL